MRAVTQTDRHAHRTANPFPYRLGVIKYLLTDFVSFSSIVNIS